MDRDKLGTDQEWEQKMLKNNGPDREQKKLGAGRIGPENFEKCWTGPDRDQKMGTSATNLDKYFIYFLCIRKNFKKKTDVLPYFFPILVSKKF